MRGMDGTSSLVVLSMRDANEGTWVTVCLVKDFFQLSTQLAR